MALSLILFLLSLAFAISSSDNSIFDSPSAALPSGERSLLPGVQVFPQGFVGRGSGVGGFPIADLESFSKNKAVQLNQENAVVSQLAQMAPQHRNKLARDIANGNVSAANELVARLMRDLAATQHGQMAFPQIALLDQTGDPLSAMLNWQSAAGLGNNPFGVPLQQQQFQLAQQQRAMLLNGGRMGGGAMNGFQQQMGGFSPLLSNGQLQSPFAGVSTSFVSPFSLGQSPFSSDSSRLLSLQSLQQPRNPFSSTADLSDLSRPNPFGPSSAASLFGSTQISPFSQTGRTKSGNSDFGRTLSGAGLGDGPREGRQRTMDDFDLGGFAASGKGFVDDVSALEQALSGNGGGRAGRTSRKGAEEKREKRH